MLKFTYCKNFASAETREVDWGVFKKTLTHSVAYPSKEASVKRSAIIGGVRDDETGGRAENVSTRTVAILDYDDLSPGTDIDDVELALELGLDCAFVAYTTFRHMPDAPRFRVAVPLSRTVRKNEYVQVVNEIRDSIGLDGLDECSYTPNQLMFLPSHREGVEPWALTNDGEPWFVHESATQDAQGGISRAEDIGEGLDDLAITVASQPLDISDDQVTMILSGYPAQGLDYDDWLRVGMAIYHQTEGDGFETWREWSSKSTKHDERHMRNKWRSFGGRADPVTMASLIKAVGGLKGEVAAQAAEEVQLSLEEQAEGVDSREDYNALKKRVQALNEVQLPPDYRSAIAAIAHEAYAKGAGMGLREVKAAFKPISKKRPAEIEGLDAPDWLEGWVYSEADCMFINTTVSDYAIKREAFRAKFDRQPEVVAMETDAATFALNMVQIPTVVRGMYWPGQPSRFESEGKDFVNTYFDSGIAPSKTLDDDEDAQAVVKLFLDHVEMLIEEPREREILLDFMAYVYNDPMHRVRWGLLLWGIEGNGKTYFYTVLQMLLGRNATVVNTSMISRPFNDWAVGARLIGIEEIRISGTNKWQILDQLKPMISNDVIAVEPKGQTRYHAPNFASYMMMTNHLDAVPVSDSDRRYCAIFTRHRTQEDLFDQLGGKDAASQYFDKLFGETRRRVDAIGCYLANRKVSSEFNPHGRAPVTKGIEEMRQANVSDDRMAIEDAMQDHKCEIISDQVLDITHLNNLVTLDGGDMPVKRALANVLRDKGMRQIDGRRVRIKQKYHYVWFRPSAGMTSDLAAKAVRDWHLKDDEFKDVPF